MHRHANAQGRCPRPGRSKLSRCASLAGAPSLPPGLPGAGAGRRPLEQCRTGGPELGMNPRLRQPLRFGSARLGREWRQSPTPCRRSGGGHVSSVSGTGPAALLAAAVAIEAVDLGGSLVWEEPPGAEPALTNSICFVPDKVVHTRFAVFRHDVAVRRRIPRRRCERAPGCRFRFLLHSPGPHSRASPCPLGRALAFRGGGAADRIRA